MHSGEDLPSVGADASLSEALVEMSRKRLGMTAVVDADGVLIGLFTDGDLRRALDSALDVRTAKIADVMTRNPRHRGRPAGRRGRAADGNPENQRPDRGR